ncbi:MAG: shikimate dehydrogenase, partial [Rikenellaceae bacterium]
YAYLTPNPYLYDLVYNPPLTQFLSFGQDRGAKICNGQAMLVGQAEAAWKIWNK